MLLRPPPLYHFSRRELLDGGAGTPIYVLPVVSLSQLAKQNGKRQTSN